MGAGITSAGKGVAPLLVLLASGKLGSASLPIRAEVSRCIGLYVASAVLGLYAWFALALFAVERRSGSRRARRSPRP